MYALGRTVLLPGELSPYQALGPESGGSVDVAPIGGGGGFPSALPRAPAPGSLDEPFVLAPLEVEVSRAGPAGGLALILAILGALVFRNV